METRQSLLKLRRLLLFVKKRESLKEMRIDGILETGKNPSLSFYSMHLLYQCSLLDKNISIAVSPSPREIGPLFFTT